MEKLSSFENGDENLYEPVVALQDYLNEIYNVAILPDGSLARKGVFPTVEKRYEHENPKGFLSKERRQEVAQHPKKVQRMNRVARLLNKTDDALVYKRGINELVRLVRGEGRLIYLEPEAHPDLLHLND